MGWGAAESPLGLTGTEDLNRRLQLVILCHFITLDVSQYGCETFSH
jgi:hypothetical protein